MDLKKAGREIKVGNRTRANKSENLVGLQINQKTLSAGSRLKGPLNVVWGAFISLYGTCFAGDGGFTLVTLFQLTAISGGSRAIPVSR